MNKKINQDEVKLKISRLKVAWEISNDCNSIFTELTFKSFREAFSFMTEIALYCEKIDHHPEWTNVYNKVKILLTTHDLGGLSEKDFILANLIDSLSLR